MDRATYFTRHLATTSSPSEPGPIQKANVPTTSGSHLRRNRPRPARAAGHLLVLLLLANFCLLLLTCSLAAQAHQHEFAHKNHHTSRQLDSLNEQGAQDDQLGSSIQVEENQIGDLNYNEALKVHHRHHSHHQPSSHHVHKHRHNHHHNHHRTGSQESLGGGADGQEGPVSLPTQSQQVPEQLPIVVSSSDNSYVSASPISEPSLANRVASQVSQRRQQHLNHHQRQRQRPLKQQANTIAATRRFTSTTYHHQPHAPPTTHLSGPPLLETSQERPPKHHRQHQEPATGPRLRPSSVHWHRVPQFTHNKLFRSSAGGARISSNNSRSSISTSSRISSSSEVGAGENNSLNSSSQEATNTNNKGQQLANSSQGAQITSSSDISTTATTTPRNLGGHDRLLANSNQQKQFALEPDSQPDVSAEYDAYNDDTDFNLANEAELDNNKQQHLRIGAHYRIQSAAIIKTRESVDMGATFLNYTIVTNLNACLVECWITDSCDTAVYQESPVEFSNHLPELSQSREHNSLTSLSSSYTTTITSGATSLNEMSDDGGDVDENNSNHIDAEQGDNNVLNENNGEFNMDGNTINRVPHQQRTVKYKLPEVGFFICYLFECAKPDGFKCRFSAHNYYVSATIRRTNSPLSKGDSSLIEEFDGGHEVEDEFSTSAQEVDLDPLKGKSSDTINFNISLFPEVQNSTNEATITKREQQPPPPWSINDPRESVNIDALTLSHDSYKTLDGYKIVSSNSKEGSEQFQNDHSRPYNQQSQQLEPLNGERVQSSEKLKSFQQQLNPNALIDSHNQQPEPHELSMEPSTDVGQLHYAKIINGLHSNHHSFANKKQWHETHIASIRIGHEDYEDYGRGNLNSAIIATMFGIGATGMIVFIVSHKMRNIRERLAYMGRRRSLVPDTDYLINTMTI